jgi:hypothetical protein
MSLRGEAAGAHNRSETVPVGFWGLDDLIVQQVTEVLNGRFRVQPSPTEETHLPVFCD